MTWRVMIFGQQNRILMVVGLNAYTRNRERLQNIVTKGIEVTATFKVDKWPWGNEVIVWGYNANHKYTLKIIEPKKGRDGCLSLQYHHKKSESWLVLKGIIWALLVIDGKVCTRLMRPGDVQNIEVGVIHRLMGASDDAKLAEPSTPDAHAADKSKVKDVVRLHCVLGREVSAPRDAAEAEVLKICIQYTNEACECIQKGEKPPEYNAELVLSHGGGKVY